MEQEKEQELELYYYQLIDAILSGISSVAMNRDRSHNAMIMKCMLDTSDSICMYCGEMSIFRNNFYEHINNCSSSKLGNTIKEFLKRSIQNFLSKETANLSIILAHKIESLPDDMIDLPIFNEHLKTGKIKIGYLQEGMVFNKGMSHFSFTDNILRVEKDMLERSAICAINPDNELLHNYRQLFQTLESVTTLIEK